MPFDLSVPLLDIHIIVNTIHSPSIYNSPAAASWIPVCLPKFNPAGFVNAYITFLRKPEHNEVDASNTDPGVLGDRQGHPSGRVADGLQQAGQLDAGIGLVCISGGGDFETVRGWCDAVAEVCDFISIPDCLLLKARLRRLAEIQQHRSSRFDMGRDKFWESTILRVPAWDTWIAALYIQIQTPCSNHVSGSRGSLR